MICRVFIPNSLLLPLIISYLAVRLSVRFGTHEQCPGLIDRGATMTGDFRASTSACLDVALSSEIRRSLVKLTALVSKLNVLSTLAVQTSPSVLRSRVLLLRSSSTYAAHICARVPTLMSCRLLFNFVRVLLQVVQCNTAVVACSTVDGVQSNHDWCRSVKSENMILRVYHRSPVICAVFFVGCTVRMIYAKILYDIAGVHSLIQMFCFERAFIRMLTSREELRPWPTTRSSPCMTWIAKTR